MRCEHSIYTTDGKEGYNRQLIIEAGKASYLRKDLMVDLSVFDQGSLYMISSGIPSLSNAAMSADLAVRSVLGFYQNFDPQDPQLLWNFLIDAHHSIQQRQRSTDVSSLGASVVILWLHNNKLTYTNIGSGQLLLQRDGTVEPLNLPQTREEMARRRGLPAPKNPQQLSQALFFGMLYPEKKRMITINEILDYDTQVLKAGDRILVGTAGFPGKELLTQGRVVETHHTTSNMAITVHVKEL